MSDEKSHEITLKADGKPLYIVKVDVGKLPRKKAEEYMSKAHKVLMEWIDEGGGLTVPATWDVVPVLVDVPEIVRRLESLEEEVASLRSKDT
jgi:hypothetical protein